MEGFDINGPLFWNAASEQTNTFYLFNHHFVKTDLDKLMLKKMSASKNFLWQSSNGYRPHILAAHNIFLLPHQYFVLRHQYFASILGFKYFQLSQNISQKLNFDDETKLIFRLMLRWKRNYWQADSAGRTHKPGKSISHFLNLNHGSLVAASAEYD